MKRIRRMLLSSIVVSLVFMFSACGSAGTDADEQGMEYFEQGKYTEALASFEEAVQADSSEALYQIHCGMAQIRLEQYEQAQAAFEIAMRMDEEAKEAYRGRGICYMKQKLYADAAADFETVLKLAGTFPDAADYDSLHWLGEAYYQAGEYEKSADVVIRLLGLDELSAEDGAFVNDLAIHVIEIEQYDLAEELLDKAVSALNGDSVQALRWNQIITAERMNKMDKARTLLEAYCSSFPTDADAALERAAVGELAASESDSEAANESDSKAASESDSEAASELDGEAESGPGEDKEDGAAD